MQKNTSAKIGNNTLVNGDCLRHIQTLPDSSIDHVVTDPSYLYLKHKLDRPFDEDLLFSEIKRVLKPKGFVVLFGRGTSFYRWNVKLAELGFKFKEEVVWNKITASSPNHPLWRIHETVSIHSVAGCIRKAKIPYVQEREFKLDRVQDDLDTLVRLLKKPKALEELREFLRSGNLLFERVEKPKTITGTSNLYRIPEHLRIANALINGKHEQSVMAVNRDVGSIHPTQKPIALIRRLLNIIGEPGDIIFEPFGGSCAIPVACVESGRRFVACEIDPEYYAAGLARLQQTLFKTST